MTRFLSRRSFKLIYQSNALFSSDLPQPNEPKFVRTIDPQQTYTNYAQRVLTGEIREGPVWLAKLKKKLKIQTEMQKSLDSELKALLDKAAMLLYYDCADNYPYLRLLHEFNLPDLMPSWYKFTLLHISMCLFKMQSSLEAAAYHQLRDGVLNSLWFDVDKRLELLGDEYNAKLNTKGEIKVMFGVYIQSLFEYDEGFLSDDCILAGALWRNLYMSKPVEPVHLNNAVRYTRATISFLDKMDVNDLIVSGVKRWEPAEQLRLEV